MSTRISSRIRAKQKTTQPAIGSPPHHKSQAAKKKEKEEAKAAAQERRRVSNNLVAQQLDTQAKENLALLHPDLEEMSSRSATEFKTGCPGLADSSKSMKRDSLPPVVNSPTSATLPQFRMGYTTWPRPEPTLKKRKTRETFEVLKLSSKELKRRRKKPTRLHSRGAIEAPSLNYNAGSKTHTRIYYCCHYIFRPAKCSKPNQVGGLKPQWKEILHQNKTPSRSASTVKSADEYEQMDEGEFVGDETPEALQAQRAGKSYGKRQIQGLLDVKLEPVDVNMIVKEELETKMPAQPPKKRVTAKVSDIPYVNVSDRSVMNISILPAVVQWVGSCEKQFAINGDPLLRSMIRKLWLGHFPSLPPTCQGPKDDTILRCDHPAIYGFLQTKLRTYRSNFGKMGAITVTQYLKQLCDNAEEETECAKDLLANNAFIYEVLGDSDDNEQNAVKPADGLVLVRKSVYPIGALALATTATSQVHWALSLRANGITNVRNEGSGEEDSDTNAATPTKAKKKGKASASIARKTENSFGEKLTREYNKYQAHTSKLSEAKWALIINASKRYIVNVPNSGAGPALKDVLAEAEANPCVDDEINSECDESIRGERRKQDVIMLSDD
ncbi:hypothetical protein C8J55DRAFT_492065 [Lentinula edodes]|uniref:Uncharacterized protein n=1 Tax=Lentinula lateritia TaxID=40482 RepID=A0A9W8ZYR2_9AGAR|nr:hypothetical protein C8J55DRAFT_492065 [Lentinula edodes]